MRAIDADALHEEISGLRVTVKGVRYGKNLLCELMTDYHKHILQAIDNAPTIDAVPVVRCEKCLWYKPPHFRADDGTETPWDGIISLGMSDGRKGIYIGGKCKHEKNTSYGETDKAFRKPYHFCSFGERRSDDL